MVPSPRVRRASGLQQRISPLPSTTHLSEVSPSRPTGPRAWNLSVLMPISAPSPNSKPSAKRGARVDHHAGRIHFAQEALRMPWSRVTMASVWWLLIAVDVRDGLVEALHHLDADDRREVLLVPVLLGRRLADLQAWHRRRSARASARTASPRPWPHRSRRSAAGIPRPRRARPAGLRWRCRGCTSASWRCRPPHGHRDIAGVVHVDVAVAVQVLDHRHLGFAADRARSGPCRRAE